MTKKIKNIIAGAGRILDFSGSAIVIEVARSRSMREYYAGRSDSEASKQDLLKVGRDLTTVMEQAKARG
ncbi:MAG: hypothetical protein AUJ49_06855 [Desulfovibrionaceae bacterium CG1_02_65_16]|nr:MAG: hypothetical protein AUJ49_06855 [Desulfovibrionaceae bacterium CG1_02_65_16]